MRKIKNLQQKKVTKSNFVLYREEKIFAVKKFESSCMNYLKPNISGMAG